MEEEEYEVGSSQQHCGVYWLDDEMGSEDLVLVEEEGALGDIIKERDQIQEVLADKEIEDQEGGRP